MAKPLITPPPLPPPTAAACWWEFLKWAAGVPLVVLGALGLIWLAYWAVGGGGMMLKSESAIGDILLWLVLIVLLYPLALVFLVWDLRDGLKAARDWTAMTPEAQATALAEAKAAVTKPKRRARKKG